MLLLGAVGRVREKAAQRGLELGARVVLAVGRVEKLAAVDQAVQARCDQVGDVVQELAPLGALGELQGAGALDQLIGVGTVGGRGGKPREKQQQEKKTLWPEPQGFALRVQLAEA
jgi:hypothetical protein